MTGAPSTWSSFAACRWTARTAGPYLPRRYHSTTEMHTEPPSQSCINYYTTSLKGKKNPHNALDSFPPLPDPSPPRNEAIPSPIRHPPRAHSTRAAFASLLYLGVRLPSGAVFTSPPVPRESATRLDARAASRAFLKARHMSLRFHRSPRAWHSFLRLDDMYVCMAGAERSRGAVCASAHTWRCARAVVSCAAG